MIQSKFNVLMLKSKYNLSMVIFHKPSISCLVKGEHLKLIYIISFNSVYKRKKFLKNIIKHQVNRKRDFIFIKCLNILRKKRFIKLNTILYQAINKNINLIAFLFRIYEIVYILNIHHQLSRARLSLKSFSPRAFKLKPFKVIE